MSMDERKLTVIVVPHGDLETRSYEIPYRRLKFFIIVAAVLVLLQAVVLATWFPVFVQSTQVASLQRELKRLEDQQAEVLELARAVEEVEEQYERVRALLGADAPTDGNPPMLPPLRTEPTPPEESVRDEPEPQGVISNWPLGSRGFITQTLSASRPSHPGLDIAVAENSYIRAAGAGIVRAADEDSIYGRHVIISHGGGLETLYGHASRILVRQGDRVAANELIGLTGSTGQSTGPHLHFEVRRDGQAVDPLLFVRQP
jgi:murein DD-endopeptidase MepM/ murein hydrolase activator NlpD